MKSDSPLKGAAPFAAASTFFAPLTTYAAEGTGRVIYSRADMLFFIDGVNLGPGH